MDMEHFKPSSERLAEALEWVLRHWRARRDPEAAVEIPVVAAPPPFTIALSCDAGANGPAVARAVADRLGWPVYDHELVDLITQQMGVPASLLESVDEKRVSWLQEFLATFFSLPGVSEASYVEHLVVTMLSLAARGQCIIVGRGAAQVLPEETTLRVRLVGPLKDRIASIRQRFGFSPEEAARWVEETDRERRSFVKDHFHKDPTEPHLYDLLVHAFRLPAGECAGLITQTLGYLQARSPAGA